MQQPTNYAGPPVWISCSADEATAIIEACRAETESGTLPVDRALDLAKAYDGLKRAPGAL